MGQRYRATCLVGGRIYRVPSFCIGHVTLERCDATGSRESGQLVARACRCSVLSCLSHDLASTALVLSSATFDADGTTLDLERGRPLNCWHDTGAGAISVASRWDQRMATSLGPEPGLRHSSRQRDNAVSTPPSHLSYPGVPSRSRRRLSRQHSPVSCRLQRSDREHMVQIRLGRIDGDHLANCFRAPLVLRRDLPNSGANQSSRHLSAFSTPGNGFIPMFSGNTARLAATQSRATNKATLLCRRTCTFWNCLLNILCRSSSVSPRLCIIPFSLYCLRSVRPITLWSASFPRMVTP
jgi:hypothetical protein